jgi:predicted permease
MIFLGEWLRRVAYLVNRRKHERELLREMEAHREMMREPRRFGNTLRLREEARDVWGWNWLDTLCRDVRYALRTLRHNPIFTVVALLTLAIGIGANTAAFSVVNSVLLQPLPYPKPDELIAVWHTAPGAPGIADVSGGLRLSPSMCVTYAETNRTFQEIGCWFAGSAAVTGVAEPEQVRALLVSGGTLQALGVQPVLGRWLSEADQIPGSPQTVMLGYGYWQRRFGGDPSVIGRRIVVDSRPREIAGVMPRGFQVVNTDPELIVPLALNRSQLILPGFGFQAVARLKAGATIEAAAADVARMVPIWMNSWPAAPGVNPRVYESWKITPALRPLKEDVLGNAANVLWVVMGTIGIVMLIACANVANLLLVRAEARQPELAIRAALGAGWRRIVRALLLESVLLGLMGGLLGLALAGAGLRFLLAAGPANLPRMNEISIDAGALGFTLAVSLLSSLLFGLIPALKYAGPRVPRARRDRWTHFKPQPRTASGARHFGDCPGDAGARAAGVFGLDDPDVSSIARCGARVYPTRAAPDDADLHSRLGGAGTGTSRANTERHSG